MDNPIIRHLHADGPHPDLPDPDLYGQFVGSWNLDHNQYDEVRGEWVRGQGECHFGWILDGRAIQDLWGFAGRGFGTTVRTYDAAQDAWRIDWIAPAWSSYGRMIGRREGDRIVQVGETGTGRPIRWSFNDITPDTFVWRGEVSDDGAGWQLVQEHHASRVQAS